jgi:hypothetical protein
VRDTTSTSAFSFTSSIQGTQNQVTRPALQLHVVPISICCAGSGEFGLQRGLRKQRRTFTVQRQHPMDGVHSTEQIRGVHLFNNATGLIVLRSKFLWRIVGAAIVLVCIHADYVSGCDRKGSSLHHIVLHYQPHQHHGSIRRSVCHVSRRTVYSCVLIFL